LAMEFAWNSGLDRVGIWQSGAPLTVDEQNGVLYFTTANGNNSEISRNEYSNCVVKAMPKFVGEKIVSFEVVDYFQPYDVEELDEKDEDLGSTQVLTIPNHGIVVAGSKAGYVYVMNASNLGKNSVNNSNVHQNFRVVPNYSNKTHYWYHNIHNLLTWESSHGPIIYVFGEADALKMFQLSKNGYFSEKPDHESTYKAPVGSMPGGILAVSSFGKENGILWATVPFAGDANKYLVPGKLIAANAENVTETLWADTLRNTFNESEIGIFAKYNPVVIHEGLVYVPTFSHQVLIYGLQPQQTPLWVIVTASAGGVVIAVIVVAIVVYHQKKQGDYGKIPTEPEDGKQLIN